MRQSIRGYADGLIEMGGAGQGPDVASVASELAAIRDLLAGSEDLRRVLSDPGLATVVRRGVVNDLLSTRVSSVTMRMVNFVLDADRANETVADVEWLVARFEAAVAGMAATADTVLGHKAAEERLDGYASAVLELVAADPRTLAEVEDELFRFQRVVGGSNQLRSALTSRDVDPGVRKRIVTDLLGGKSTLATLAMASYATQVGRPRDYEDLLETLVSRVAAQANRRLAEVRSAVEMSDEQQRKLAGALARAVGHDVEVRVTVDPSVVAGFVATIGDTVVDGSARHQLEILKERLASPEVTTTTGERH